VFIVLQILDVHENIVNSSNYVILKLIDFHKTYSPPIPNAKFKIWQPSSITQFTLLSGYGTEFFPPMVYLYS
jgi:hypothetical protein